MHEMPKSTGPEGARHLVFFSKSAAQMGARIPKIIIKFGVHEHFEHVQYPALKCCCHREKKQQQSGQSIRDCHIVTVKTAAHTHETNDWCYVPPQRDSHRLVVMVARTSTHFPDY